MSRLLKSRTPPTLISPVCSQRDPAPLTRTVLIVSTGLARVANESAVAVPARRMPPSSTSSDDWLLLIPPKITVLVVLTCEPAPVMVMLQSEKPTSSPAYARWIAFASTRAPFSTKK